MGGCGTGADSTAGPSSAGADCVMPKYTEPPASAQAGGPGVVSAESGVAITAANRPSATLWFKQNMDV